MVLLQRLTANISAQRLIWAFGCWNPPSCSFSWWCGAATWSCIGCGHGQWMWMVTMGNGDNKEMVVVEQGWQWVDGGWASWMMVVVEEEHGLTHKLSFGFCWQKLKLDLGVTWGKDHYIALTCTCSISQHSAVEYCVIYVMWLLPGPSPSQFELILFLPSILWHFFGVALPDRCPVISFFHGWWLWWWSID